MNSRLRLLLICAGSGLLLPSMIGNPARSKSLVSDREYLANEDRLVLKPKINQRLYAYINLLKDRDWQTRHKAISELAELKDAEAVEPLIELLNDSENKVRSNAAYALGKLKDPRAVKMLIKALEDDDKIVRGTAAWALGEIGDQGAQDSLIKILSDKQLEVRYESMLALTRFETPEAKKALARALQKEERDINSGIAHILSDFGDSAISRQPVTANSNDSSGNTDPNRNTPSTSERHDRTTAPPHNSGSSDSMGGNLISNDLQDEIRTLILALRSEDGSTRIEATRSLGELADRRALNALIELLASDGLSDVRYNAAWALGELGDEAAIEPLIQALQDDNKYVRTNAILALAKLHAILAQDDIVSALLNDVSSIVRSTAALALGELRDSQSAGPLVQALHDPRQSVRDNAAIALREIGDFDADIAPQLRRILATETDDSVKAAIRGILRRLHRTQE